jgi:hypothetical protein
MIILLVVITFDHDRHNSNYDCEEDDNDEVNADFL